MTEGFDSRDLLAEAIVEEFRGLKVCLLHPRPLYFDGVWCPCCGVEEEFYVSHKEKVRMWLDEARERLHRATAGSVLHRETEETILMYEKLLEQMGEKPQREPGEDSPQ